MAAACWADILYANAKWDSKTVDLRVTGLTNLRWLLVQMCQTRITNVDRGIQKRDGTDTKTKTFSLDEIANLMIDISPFSWVSQNWPVVVFEIKDRLQRAREAQEAAPLPIALDLDDDDRGGPGGGAAGPASPVSPSKRIRSAGKGGDA